MIPDLIVVGHLTRDEQPDGTFTLGGAATFSAIAARNLGYRVGVLTRAAKEIPQPDLLRDIQVVRLSAPTTTTFQNVYQQGKRRQFVREVAPSIHAADIPPEWRDVKMALLGPVANELDADIVRAFSDQTLIAVMPQGWMRQWDETGRVKPRAWNEAQDILPRVKALILSQEDLGLYTERLSSYTALAPLVALTRGEEGVTIYHKQSPPLDVPAFPTTVVDPTGAGDSFAAGFVIRYYETDDVLQAARFANATAALSIASYGAATMPTRAQVEAFLARQP